MTAHLTVSQRAVAYRLRSEGRSLRYIARQIGCSHSGIDVMFKNRQRVPKPDVWTPRKGNLTILEREQILLGIASQKSLSAIARELSRSPSAVTRPSESEWWP